MSALATLTPSAAAGSPVGKPEPAEPFTPGAAMSPPDSSTPEFTDDGTPSGTDDMEQDNMSVVDDDDAASLASVDDDAVSLTDDSPVRALSPCCCCRAD